MERHGDLGQRRVLDLGDALVIGDSGGHQEGILALGDRQTGGGLDAQA